VQQKASWEMVSKFATDRTNTRVFIRINLKVAYRSGEYQSDVLIATRQGKIIYGNREDSIANILSMDRSNTVDMYK